MSIAAILANGLGELGLVIPDAAREQLVRYLALIEKWNRTFNLTAIHDAREMVTHHLLDSLAVLSHLPTGRLADVGAGAGLPGIPIAIAQPDRAVTLNDASGKRCAFLRQAAIELQLVNVHVHAGRAETWRPTERFDVVICRAYADLAKFVAQCRHLLAPGGVLAAMKGAYPAAELARIPVGCDCSDIRRLRVPLLDGERHLVLCRIGGPA